MLALGRHPNLVSVYHAVTHTHTHKPSQAPSAGRTASSAMDVLPALLDPAQRTCSITAGSASRVQSITVSFSDHSAMLSSGPSPSQSSWDAQLAGLQSCVLAATAARPAGSVHASAASFVESSSSMTLPLRGISSYSLGPQSSAGQLQQVAGAGGSFSAGHPAIVIGSQDLTAATASLAAKQAAKSQMEDSAQLEALRAGSFLTSPGKQPGAKSSLLPFLAAGHAAAAGEGGRCSGAASAAETWCV